jgi:hypothetical protein
LWENAAKEDIRAMTPGRPTIDQNPNKENQELREPMILDIEMKEETWFLDGLTLELGLKVI